MEIYSLDYKFFIINNNNKKIYYINLKKNKKELFMKAYRFITEEDNSKFCHRVTEALSKGWKLYGEPQLTYNNMSGLMHCGQAVTKNTELEYSSDLKLSNI